MLFVICKDLSNLEIGRPLQKTNNANSKKTKFAKKHKKNAQQSAF